MTLDEFGERIDVVLVRPQISGNIGSTARAMANTGLRHLVVAAPQAFDPETARWMAGGGRTLLDSAVFTADLPAALTRVSTAYATTARHRRRDLPVMGPTEVARAILADHGRAALVFGPEDDGLSNADVDRCGALVRIATPTAASLNLSQAVLILGWALWTEAQAAGLKPTGRLLAGTRRPRATADLDRPDRKDLRASAADTEPLAAAVLALLTDMGRAAEGKRVERTVRAALMRAAPTLREVHAMRGLIRDLHRRVAEPKG